MKRHIILTILWETTEHTVRRDSVFVKVVLLVWGLILWPCIMWWILYVLARTDAERMCFVVNLVTILGYVIVDLATLKFWPQVKMHSRHMRRAQCSISARERIKGEGDVDRFQINRKDSRDFRGATSQKWELYSTIQPAIDPKWAKEHVQHYDAASLFFITA